MNQKTDIDYWDNVPHGIIDETAKQINLSVLISELDGVEQISENEWDFKGVGKNEIKKLTIESDNHEVKLLKGYWEDITLLLKVIGAKTRILLLQLTTVQTH